MSTVEDFRLARRRFTISPAFEKFFSDGTEVAGMPRYLSASTATERVEMRQLVYQWRHVRHARRLASPQRDFKWNPTDRLLMAGTRSNAGAINGTRPWSPALWCRCNASTARAVVFKLSLKNKVSLTLWKNNTGRAYWVIPGYPGICRVPG